jgi:hypothetical protein
LITEKSHSHVVGIVSSDILNIMYAGCLEALFHNSDKLNEKYVVSIHSSFSFSSAHFIYRK